MIKQIIKSQSGFSPTALIGAVAVILVIAVGCFLIFQSDDDGNLRINNDTQPVGSSSATFKQTQKVEYDLVREKFSLSDEQVEILKKVNQQDTSL